jgi:ELWxxDGT repeat protein
MQSLYFSANDGLHGFELGVLREDGTRQLIDVEPGPFGSRPANFTQVGDELYFSAVREAGGSALWKVRSDGSVVQVAVFESVQLQGLTEFNGALYFSATTAAAGFELWSLRSDGTVVQYDLNPGASSSFASSFTAFNGELYFSAFTGAGQELYKVTADGSIVLAADINSGQR